MDCPGWTEAERVTDLVWITPTHRWAEEPAVRDGDRRLDRLLGSDLRPAPILLRLAREHDSVGRRSRAREPSVRQQVAEECDAESREPLGSLTDPTQIKVNPPGHPIRDRTVLTPRPGTFDRQPDGEASSRHLTPASFERRASMASLHR
jgi:hypothetical protein